MPVGGGKYWLADDAERCGEMLAGADDAEGAGKCWRDVVRCSANFKKYL